MITAARIGNDERGEVNPFLVTTVIFILLAIGLGVGFGWAYMQMTDYRDNVDSKVNIAVEDARKVQKTVDDKLFAEEFKKPNSKFQGPADSGSVSFNYPKTWSLYIDQIETDGGNIEAYFNPKQVVTVDESKAYALRVVISDNSYDKILKSYEAKIKKGELSAEPITIGKTDTFSGYKGTRIDGQFAESINGSVVVLKIRDKTLQLFVDSQDFMNDFNNTILSSLTYES